MPSPLLLLLLPASESGAPGATTAVGVLPASSLSSTGDFEESGGAWAMMLFAECLREPFRSVPPSRTIVMTSPRELIKRPAHCLLLEAAGGRREKVGLRTDSEGTTVLRSEGLEED